MREGWCESSTPQKENDGHVVQPNVYVTVTTLLRQAIKLNTSRQMLRFANGEQRRE